MEMTKLLCPHREGAGSPHPIRVGGPDLWYQMALVDTTVEQSLVSSAEGTRGRDSPRECVRVRAGPRATGTCQVGCLAEARRAQSMVKMKPARST